MKKALIYITIIIFAIGSCKKVDLDEVPSGDPVFTANAQLDGVDLNLVAGDDDFYMFSEFSKDIFGVYTMTGRFAKDSNCQNDCEESLSFSIRSSYVDSLPNEPFDINQAIVTGSDFNYFTDNVISIQNGFRYNFNAQLIDSFFNISADSFLWTINGETFTDEFFTFDYFDNTDLDVRLEVLTNDNCVSYFEKILPIGMDDDCELNIDVIFGINQGEYELIPNLNTSPSGGNPSYDWIPNNNPNGISFLIDSTFQIPQTNIISLSAYNNICTLNMGVCIGGNPGSVMPSSISYSKFDFTVDSISIVTTVLQEQLSTVTIEYQGASGTYSSEFADNSSSNNTFTILKIEDYDNNENGEKTKKVTIEYDCILIKQGSAEEKNISGTAEIAVAYPE